VRRKRRSEREEGRKGRVGRRKWRRGEEVEEPPKRRLPLLLSTDSASSPAPGSPLVPALLLARRALWYSSPRLPLYSPTGLWFAISSPPRCQPLLRCTPRPFCGPSARPLPAPSLTVSAAAALWPPQAGAAPASLLASLAPERLPAGPCAHCARPSCHCHCCW